MALSGWQSLWVSYKLSYSRQLPLSLPAPDVIDSLHLIGIVTDMTDLEWLCGTDYQCLAFCLTLPDMFQLFVVHDVAHIEGMHQVWIFAQGYPKEWH